MQVVREKSDSELLTMVYDFNEWDAEMLQAVEDELQQRQLLPDDVAARKKEIIDAYQENLKNGKQASVGSQLLGWLCVLGLLGLIIGYNHAFSKTRSRYTGEKFYTYNEPSRENGRYIFYTGITVTVLVLFYKVIQLRGNYF